MSEAVKFKREGVSAGVPDLCIPKAKKPYHGLYIELKRTSKARVSKSQKEWIDYLNLEGYKAVVCYGFDETVEVIEKYLKGEDF